MGPRNAYIHLLGAHERRSLAFPPTLTTACGLSLTPENNLLVTCRDSHKLLELCAESGQCVREVELLLSGIRRPWHAFQLANQNYVVAHDDDTLSRVSAVDAGGKALFVYGDQHGSDITKFTYPCHLTVDKENFMFVADRNSRRVMLLTPGLEFVRHIEFNEKPWRLYLDCRTRRLYIGDTDGDVIVLQV